LPAHRFNSAATRFMIGAAGGTDIMDTLGVPEVLIFGQFRFDRRARALFRRDEAGQFVQVPIGSRALDVLAVLIGRAGELVSREELMRAVWPGVVVEEANLAVQISNLRRFIDDGVAETSCVRTVPGRGYRFTPAVTAYEASTSEFSVDSATMEPPASRRGRWPLIASGLVAIAFVASLAGWFVFDRHASIQHDPGQVAIVVMPFTNVGDDPEQAWFADAITSNLTTDLSRIAGISVIAYSSAATYRDKHLDARQIGSELGVSHVLEGSVQRLPETVEVNARLADAKSGALIWADRFETTRREVPRTEADITGRLANSLNLQLVTAAARAADLSGNVDPEAGDLIMRGWAAWYRPFSAANRKEALEDFERALAKASTSTEARIGVATILVTNIGTGLSRDAAADAARTERLIQEALETDPNNSAAHTVLGTLRRWQNRLEEARHEQEVAISLDRNNAHALLQLAQAMMFLGRPAEAIPVVRAHNRLNPRDPNAAWSDWTLGVCQLLLGDTEGAIRLLRQARNRNPRVWYFQLYLASALGLHGDLDDARVALAEAVRLSPAAGSFTGWRAAQPWITHAEYWGLIEKTAAIGLRAAGIGE
jgi:TolB-like protein/DNA-binding winged helix-turn-helix (wHTH) protein/Tfp pilus assembly protein PilF